MAKTNKGKSVELNIPEGFIRLKARSLSMEGCWISEDWDEIGSAYIIVARRHPNGNITAGMFFIDLLCLGAKQTQSVYDMPAMEFENLLNTVRDNMEMELADYELVHGIIYGAVDFARKYGFEPHEGFELVSHLLEEDAPEKRKYDIDFGVDGKPMYIQSELESKKRQAEIMKQLEKTAGPGNFYHNDNMPAKNALQELLDKTGLTESELKEKLKEYKEDLKDSETFQFKVQLNNITKPPVWRRITVPSYYTFAHLHNIIQAVFGWNNYHLYSFLPSGYGSSPDITNLDTEENIFSGDTTGKLDSSEVRLYEFFDKVGQHFTYIYDFGDDWIHRITLEKILPEVTWEPTCPAGKGACPPEDCGGPWGYANLKEIMADKNHPEYEENAEWFGLEEGESWDPNEFDLEEAQSFLKELYGTEEEQ